MDLNWLFGFGALLIGYTALLFGLFVYFLKLKLDPIDKKLGNHITETNKKIDKLDTKIDNKIDK